MEIRFFAGQYPLNSAESLAVWGKKLPVGADVLVQTDLEWQAAVFTHALADVLAFDTNADACSCQYVTASDAGQLEHLGCGDGAHAKDDFAFCTEGRGGLPRRCC